MNLDLLPINYQQSPKKRRQLNLYNIMGLIIIVGSIALATCIVYLCCHGGI